MHYLVIRLGDQSNLQAVKTPPALQTYIKNIHIQLQLEQLSSRPLSFSTQVDQDYAITLPLPEPLTQYGRLDIQLQHPEHPVSVIGQNGEAIPPSAQLSVSPVVWQAQCCLNLTLLAPPLLFNFRQDAYAAQNQLSQAELELYEALLPLFPPDTDSLAQAASIRDAFSAEEISFFKRQGNNVCFFIHGYNVGFGKARDPDDDLSPTAAHQWFSRMEYNLNTAAGWDGQNDIPYTRIAGIAWQGNPKNPGDFRADYAMTGFAAQKLVGLLQQLQDHGITINLIAHSCGCQVLLETLNLAAVAGIQVNQAILWEAAVSNRALDASSLLLPLDLRASSHSSEKILSTPSYFPETLKATQGLTILYSKQDTILGNIAAKPTQKTWSAEAIHDFYLMCCGETPFVAMDTVGRILHQTFTDKGAGLCFAAPAAAMFLLDRYGMDHISKQLELISIYHLAQLFVEPFSFFMQSTDFILQFYQRWISQYTHFILPEQGKNQCLSFLPDLQAQKTLIQNALPEAYNLLAVGLYLALYFATQPDRTAKDCPALCRWVKEISGLFQSHDALNTQTEAFATLMLSIILTPDVPIAPALGYKGLDPQSPHLFNPQIFSSAQQNDQGQNLCIDHSAMLFPSSDFMRYIYQGILFSGKAGSLRQFGSYELKPA